MKKLLFTLAAIGISFGITAQTTTTVTTPKTAKKEKKESKKEAAVPAAKDNNGAVSNAPLKKDGTPDMRYKVNKEAAAKKTDNKK